MSPTKTIAQRLADILDSVGADDLAAIDAQIEDATRRLNTLTHARRLIVQRIGGATPRAPALPKSEGVESADSTADQIEYEMQGRGPCSYADLQAYLPHIKPKTIHKALTRDKRRFRLTADGVRWEPTPSPIERARQALEAGALPAEPTDQHLHDASNYVAPNMLVNGNCQPHPLNPPESFITQEAIEAAALPAVERGVDVAIEKASGTGRIGIHPGESRPIGAICVEPDKYDYSDSLSRLEAMGVRVNLDAVEARTEAARPTRQEAAAAAVSAHPPRELGVPAWDRARDRLQASSLTPEATADVQKSIGWAKENPPATDLDDERFDPAPAPIVKPKPAVPRPAPKIEPIGGLGRIERFPEPPRGQKIEPPVSRAPSMPANFGGGAPLTDADKASIEAAAGMIRANGGKATLIEKLAEGVGVEKLTLRYLLGRDGRFANNRWGWYLVKN